MLNGFFQSHKPSQTVVPYCRVIRLLVMVVGVLGGSILGLE